MVSRIKACSALVVLVVSGAHLGAALAGDAKTDGLFDSVTVYGGQGVDHNLLEMPGKIVSADIEWDKSYFTAIAAGKTGGTLGESIKVLQNTPFAPVSHGYELILLKHRGLQTNVELGAAYLLRTPSAYLGPVGVNLAAGTGLSYAFSTPAYEDGPKNDPDRHYRLQLLALFELEWRLRGVEQFSVVTRAHHRSGVYGLIAPRHVGSNFLSLGIRYQF